MKMTRRRRREKKAETNGRERCAAFQKSEVAERERFLFPFFPFFFFSFFFHPLLLLSVIEIVELGTSLLSLFLPLVVRLSLCRLSEIGPEGGGRQTVFFFGGGGSFFWSSGGETERERALREHESGSLLINETNFRRQKKTGKFATRSFLFFLSLAHAFLQNGARPGVLCALCNGFPGRGACYERLHGSGVCEKKRMRERANSLSLRQLLVARSLLARERERGVLPRAKLFFPKPHFPLFASRDSKHLISIW